MTSEVAGAPRRPNAKGPGEGGETGGSTPEPSVLIERLVRANDEIARLQADLQLERERTAGADAAVSLRAIELDATRRTWSWRITAPLRIVRRAQLARFGKESGVPQTAQPRNSSQTQTSERASVPASDDRLVARGRAVEALWSRAVTAGGLLDGAVPETVELGAAGAESLARYAEAVGRAAECEGRSGRLAWLTALVVLGKNPAPADVDRARRAIGSGVESVARFVLGEFEREMALHEPRDVLLQPVVGETLVDLSTSLDSTDLAGIQRVVRSVIPRWLASRRFVAVSWDANAAGFVAVSDERLQSLVYGDGAPMPPQQKPPPQQNPPVQGARPPRLVVPWDCRYVVPELAVGSHERMSAMRALVTDGPLSSRSHD